MVRGVALFRVRGVALFRVRSVALFRVGVWPCLGLGCGLV